MSPRDRPTHSHSRRHENYEGSHEQRYSSFSYPDDSRYVRTTYEHNETDYSSPSRRDSRSHSSAFASSSPPSQTPPRQQYDGPHHWHAVPRPWATADAQPQQSARNQPTNGTYASLSSHQYHPQGSASGQEHLDSNGSARQPRSDPTNPTGRFMLSDLQGFDNSREPTNNTDLWMRQSQRESAWNGVGYVRIDGEGRRRTGPP